MVIVVVVTTNAQTSAQQYQYWIRYQNQLSFSPSLYWVNEIDNRRYVDPDIAYQLIIHTRLHYKIKRFDFGAGLTYSLYFSSRSASTYDKPLSEIRPVVEASHEFPLWKVFIQNRIRVDDRYLQSGPEYSVFEESTHIYRFRYRLQLRIPITRNDDGTPRSLIRLSDEIMINSGHNDYDLFDQNRIYISYETPLSKRLGVEVGYLYLHQELYDKNVLRVALLHRIKRY
jgi:hypothetical protein